MSKAKRLHPIAIVLNAIKVLKDAFLPMIALFFFQGGSINGWNYFDLLIPTIYFFGSIMYGVLHWFTFTYRVEEGEVRIDSGLIIKKKRYIRLERIQSIDVTEGILQRLFSLVKVSIETAGSSTGSAEAVLMAIPKTEAALFQSLLKEKKNNHSEPMDEARQIKNVSDEEKVVFRMTLTQLLVMAATSGGIGVVFAGALTLVFQFEIYTLDIVQNEMEKLFASGIFLFVFFSLGILFVAYIFATIHTLLKYAFFTVKKANEELVISRGLLEKRQLTIPITRIQAVRIEENLVRQPLGYATVYLETTSGSAEEKGNAKVMVLPLAKKARLKELFSMIEIDYELDVALTPAPKRALIRYLNREWLWVIPVTAVLLYFFQPWGYVALLLPIIFTVYGLVCYRTASWNIFAQQLMLIYREYFIKKTYIVKKRKIQSLTIKQNWFQRRKHLGTVSAFSKTGIGPSNGTVIDLEEKDVLIIKGWLQGKD